MTLASRGIDVRQSTGQIVFRASLKDSTGAKLTAGTPTLAIYALVSDGTLLSYDFADNTFKATALSTPTVNMVHRTGNNGTVNTGIWSYALSTLTGFTVGGVYIAQVTLATASPPDQEREFQFGGDQGDQVAQTGDAYTLLGTKIPQNIPFVSVGGTQTPQAQVVDYATNKDPKTSVETAGGTLANLSLAVDTVGSHLPAHSPGTEGGLPVLDSNLSVAANVAYYLTTDVNELGGIPASNVPDEFAGEWLMVAHMFPEFLAPFGLVATGTATTAAALGAYQFQTLDVVDGNYCLLFVHDRAVPGYYLGFAGSGNHAGEYVIAQSLASPSGAWWVFDQDNSYGNGPIGRYWPMGTASGTIDVVVQVSSELATAAGQSLQATSSGQTSILNAVAGVKTPKQIISENTVIRSES